MNSISITCFRRPGYANSVLDALLKCRQLECFDLLYISLDRHETSAEFLKAFDRSIASRINLVIDVHHPLGVNFNNLYAFDQVLSRGSSFNVCLEDDTVPSQDALELALWTKRILERDKRICCASLYGDDGPEANPSVMTFIDNFCPWGWCFTREKFLSVIRPHWMCPVSYFPHPVNGWDWSISQICVNSAMKCIHPLVSRIRNIGKLDGEYLSPEMWDSTFSGRYHSDGTFNGEFNLV